MGNKRRRLEQRREEAVSRQAERDSRTPEEQLEKLDLLLGVGEGAKKERARLHRIIEEVALKKRRKKKDLSTSKESSKKAKKNNKRKGDL